MFVMKKLNSNLTLSPNDHKRMQSIVSIETCIWNEQRRGN